MYYPTNPTASQMFHLYRSAVKGVRAIVNQDALYLRFMKLTECDVEEAIGRTRTACQSLPYPKERDKMLIFLNRLEEKYKSHHKTERYFVVSGRFGTDTTFQYTYTDISSVRENLGNFCEYLNREDTLPSATELVSKVGSYCALLENPNKVMQNEHFCLDAAGTDNYVAVKEINLSEYALLSQELSLI